MTNPPKYWALENLWSLNEHQQEVLDKYYLLHWSPTHLMKEISFEDDGSWIKHQDIQYRVTLLNATLPKLMLDKNVALSFRKHKDATDGVVLIKRIT